MRCPRRLAPWDGFLDEQRAALGKVVAFLPETMQLFESQHLIEGTGRRLADTSPIGSERDLELFHHTAVEQPVRLITDKLLRVQHDSNSPFAAVGDGVLFENHMNVLNPDAPPSTSVAPLTPPPPARSRNKKIAIRPDQICVYQSSHGKRTLAYLLEYKAPPMCARGLRP